MTRRDWWIGIVVIVVTLLAHAAVPRYEWAHADGFAWTRADRWTGTVTLWHAEYGVIKPAR